MGLRTERSRSLGQTTWHNFGFSDIGKNTYSLYALVMTSLPDQGTGASPFPRLRKSASELHERPQQYNELFSNCTTNVRLHVKHIGYARPWDWQILINGFIAEHAYELGEIDTSLPFPELRRLSYIDYRARAADDDPRFSSLIQEGLPGNGCSNSIDLIIQAGRPFRIHPSWQGEYMLRSRYQPGHQQRSLPEPTAEELENEADTASEETTGIIQSLGMYWSRSLVVWTNNPSLPGQQQTGAKPVDFSSQRGVYLLYDDRGVIYVGRATDQGLGKRLYQHTVDRLASRWNRFSWFGILRVTPDGTLAEEQPRVLPQEVIVATMEALLIEGLEPPQNRRRGDDFRAIEYIQREDPELERRRLASLLGEIQSRLNLR
jgi:hypothetical protein